LFPARYVGSLSSQEVLQRSWFPRVYLGFRDCSRHLDCGRNRPTAFPTRRKAADVCRRSFVELLGALFWHLHFSGRPLPLHQSPRCPRSQLSFGLTCCFVRRGAGDGRGEIQAHSARNQSRDRLSVQFDALACRRSRLSYSRNFHFRLRLRTSVGFLDRGCASGRTFST
jgi:hypothetical protein